MDFKKLLKITILQQETPFNNTKDENIIKLDSSNNKCSKEVNSLEPSEHLERNEFVIYKSYRLRKLMRDLDIHRRDQKSIRMKSDLETYFADLFKIIEEVRDIFSHLAFEHLGKEEGRRKLLQHLELMKPVQFIWTDIIKRCTCLSNTPTKNIPFNFKLETYEGHFLTKSPNGKVKLRIPVRVRLTYVRELVKAYRSMSEHLSNFREELKNVHGLRLDKHLKDSEEKTNTKCIIKIKFEREKHDETINFEQEKHGETESNIPGIEKTHE